MTTTDTVTDPRAARGADGPVASPGDDNRARECAAAALIVGYSARKVPAASEPLDPDDLRDVMADAMHLCRREGWDFAEILGDARWNFDREVEEAS